MKKSFFRRGFTLIELMIVIVILGVLMGTILPRITGMQDRAKDTATIANINTISQALEAYYSDGNNNSYPDAMTTMGSPWASCLGVGTSPVNTAIVKYIKGGTIPKPVVTVKDVLGLTTCDVPATSGYAYANISNGYVVAGSTVAKNNFTFNDANAMTSGDGLTDLGSYGAGNDTGDTDYDLQFYIATN